MTTEADLLYGTTLSIESMKVIAESIGIGNLPDEAAKELADDVSYRLKLIIQESAKFMHHAKRQKLSPNDIDHALKINNVEVFVVFLEVFGCYIYFCCSLSMGSSRKISSRFVSLPAVVENYILRKKKNWISTKSFRASIRRYH